MNIITSTKSVSAAVPTIPRKSQQIRLNIRQKLNEKQEMNNILDELEK